MSGLWKTAFYISHKWKRPYLVSLCVLVPIWLPRPLIRFEAVPARLILGWGAMETRCGVVKVSLFEIILEDDGVTMELPPIVLRFLSVRTVLPELLDLFLPVAAVVEMEGSGNLTEIGILILELALDGKALTWRLMRLSFPRTSRPWRLWTGAGPGPCSQTEHSPGLPVPSLEAAHRA